MPYDIGDALKRIEDILLGSIRRNMLRHVGEERREGFDWTMWQTEQLASIRRWSAANLQRHAKDFTRINNAAISLLQQSAVSAETQAEQTLLQTGIQKADEFFDIPDAKLDALLIATRQDLSTAEHALLRKADDVYRKAVFDANVYLQSGAGTMKDAVEMAVEDMRAKGIRAVTYRNGAQVEASSYARMVLRTANVRARMAGEGRARDKAGIHTVLVPPSGIACRRCAPWMGRVLVDDVYCSGTAQEAAELGVPLLSEAIRQGFLHPQCNCSPHMFLPGISKMPEVTPEDRDEAVRRYDLTQRQRYNERQICKWKAIERDAPDARTREKAAARRRSWQQANKTLCNENPGILRRDYEREKLFDLPDKPIVPEVIEKAEEAGEKVEVRETVQNLDQSSSVIQFEESDANYMSNSFRPEYSGETSIDLETVVIPVKRVENSEFDMVADTEATRRSKAVRLTERLLKQAQSYLPDGFMLPRVAVVDFSTHKLNANAIGGYHAGSNSLFLNSIFDTPEKILRFVNRYEGEFANHTTLAPILHELGHKFYEDCVKGLAKSKNISYNKAKGILDSRIYEYIHDRKVSDKLGTVLSEYAQTGYDRNKYTEIIAECFSVYKENPFANGLLELMRG